ncbi:MAG: hypothetical protein CVU97_06295 [Firmicutes bacterium HGW-Firmicutes-21]|nr:MAG: hypothetical protein CVU97_06295 [Firmicutes bacterium HGW-Firmicutes-21]
MTGNEWVVEFIVSPSINKLSFESIIEFEYNHGLLEISIKYDYSDSPLVLSAECNDGDGAKLINRGYRLELYINNILSDEEWPYGNDLINSDILDRLNACVLSESDTPLSVPAVGFNPHGWKPNNRINVGDCMPFADGDTFHVYYLKDRRNHGSKWKKGGHQWAHIKTKDLKNWCECPLAIEINDIDEGSFCTGSLVKHKNLYYAYYAIRTMDESPSRISYATSLDADTFIKSNDFFTISPPYEPISARDPKAYIDEHGDINLLITTSLIGNRDSKGCIARVTSKDGAEWQDASPMIVLDIEDQPECSDYFEFNGFYYLVYSNFGTGRYFLFKDSVRSVERTGNEYY